MVSTGVVDLTYVTDNDNDDSGTTLVPKVEVEDITMEEVNEEQKQKYDWENEDLDLGNGKVEEELVTQFTHIPAEIPGVRMAAHVKPDTGAVEAPPVPTMSYLAAAARANAGLV